MASPKPNLGPDGLPKASTLRTSLCRHGALTLELLDPEGQAFAKAVLDFEGALELCDHIGTTLEAFAKDHGFLPDEDEPATDQVH